MTATQTAPRQPDAADALMAGRPYPARDFRVAITGGVAAAHLDAIRDWWFDVARGCADLGAKALANGDISVADECLADGYDALAQGNRYTHRITP